MILDEMLTDLSDSAHIHPANGGQGLNASIQDAINLTWKLALTLQTQTPSKSPSLVTSSLLSSYSAERVPVIQEMLFMTQSIMQKSFDADVSMEEAFTRNEMKTRMLGINYRGSSIVLDERNGAQQNNIGNNPYECLDGKLCAGDRAPDASGLVYLHGGQGSTSLFTLFSGLVHTVIIFSPSAKAIPENVTPSLMLFPESIARNLILILHPDDQNEDVERGFAVVVRDGASHAMRAYKASPTTGGLVVIRPDGYVGAVACGVKGVSDYFSQLMK